MRIITVEFDDWDRPPIGCLLVEDDEAIGTIERLQAIGGPFRVLQEAPRTEEEMIAHMRDIMGEDGEGEEGEEGKEGNTSGPVNKG